MCSKRSTRKWCAGIRTSLANLTANDSKAVLRNWEQIKAEERAGKGGARDKKTESVLSGVSRSLPALMEADHLTRKAARIRFDWEQARDITEKIREELREVDELLPVRASQARPQQESAEGQRIEEEVGDLLFAAVNLARFLEIDPEVSLKKANAKFKRRFEWMEGAAVKKGARWRLCLAIVWKSFGASPRRKLQLRRARAEIQSANLSRFARASKLK